jgi:hypothetical protein
MSECAGVQTAQDPLSAKNGNRSARPPDRFDPEQRSEAPRLAAVMTRQWFGHKSSDFNRQIVYPRNCF